MSYLFRASKGGYTMDGAIELHHRNPPIWADYNGRRVEYRIIGKPVCLVLLYEAVGYLWWQHGLPVGGVKSAPIEISFKNLPWGQSVLDGYEDEGFFIRSVVASRGEESKILMAYLRSRNAYFKLLEKWRAEWDKQKGRD